MSRQTFVEAILNSMGLGHILLVASFVLSLGCNKKQEANQSSYSSTCTTSPETLRAKMSSMSSTHAPATNWFADETGVDKTHSAEIDLIKSALAKDLSMANTLTLQNSDLSLSNTKLAIVLKNSCSGGTLSSLVKAKHSKNSHLEVQAYSVKGSDVGVLNVEDLQNLTSNDPCLLSVAIDQKVEQMAVFTDPYYTSQAHLAKLNFPTAYPKFYEQSPTISQAVVVAVVDTGVNYSHVDLSSQMWTDPSDSTKKGYDFLNNDDDPMDDDGHGTHVSGLIAAAKNASGGVGIAPTFVKIMAVKVLDSTGGSVSTVINGITYAVSKGAQVINLSLGAQGADSMIKSAVQSAVSQGVVVVSAAGNSAVEISSTRLFVPAGYAKDIDGMISVGSVDTKNLSLSSFSNYSTSYVEISAPGSEDSARSSTIGGLYSTYGSGYLRLSGTSMASPLVAGSAALAIGFLKALGKNPTPAEIEYLLKASSKRYNALWNKIQYGRLLDLSLLADNALAYGQGQSVPQPTACY